jgi:hypothetical protein
MEGRWQVFGMDIDMAGDVADWRAHPVSRSPTRRVAWFRVRHLRGETGGDVKFIWELNRHAELVRLAQAFSLTGKERYAERLRDLLVQWMEQNPPGIGVNWTSSLEVGIRAVAWCWIWHLTKHASVWTDAVLGQFLWSLWHHARHVEQYDSSHHSPNTHLTGEALALVYVGTLFPEFGRANRWRRRGTAILLGEIDRQILPDGMHIERSTCYHRYTLEFYLHFYLLAGAALGESRDLVRDALYRLLDVAVQLRRPDGAWPVLGDEDGGRLLPLALSVPTDQDELLTVGGLLLGRPDWMVARRWTPASYAWWVLDEHCWESAGTEESLLARPSAALPAAGYYVGRDSRQEDGWYCLVDAGPLETGWAGHGHADLGHVEIVCGKVPVFSDPGSFSYTTSLRLRDWHRSEAAHACLSIPDLPLAVPDGPFSWKRLAPRPEAQSRDLGSVWFCSLQVARSGRGAGVRHVRQVVLVRGWGIAVCDWLGGSGQRTVDLNWPTPWHSDHIQLCQTHARIADVALRWFADGAGPPPEVLLRSVPYAPTYGILRWANQITTRYDATLPAVFVSCITKAMQGYEGRQVGPERIQLIVGAESSRLELTLSPHEQPTFRELAWLREGHQGAHGDV